MKPAIISTIAAAFTLCTGGVNACADSYSDTQQCLQGYYTKVYAQALPFCIRSAQTGNSQSQYVLGLMYSNGMGAKKNKTEALKWLRAAADQAYAAAHYKLDQLENEPVSSDDVMRRFMDKQKRAGMAEQQAASAAPGRTAAHSTLRPATPPPDDNALYQQYLTGAQAGDAHARLMLGLFYLEGRRVQKDAALAGKWIKQAAHQGLAEAQLAMGLLYHQGYAGTAPSIKNAMFWFIKAAEQGLPDAQYCLGLIYANGENGEKNETEALKWWRKAATQGYAKAQHNLAVMYLKGIAVKPERNKAIQWFIAEAEHGDPQSQFNMGRIYSEGKWLDPSGSDAANWFYRAGETWLSMKQMDKARQSAEKIRQLASTQHLNTANLFLADVLTKKIEESAVQ